MNESYSNPSDAFHKKQGDNMIQWPRKPLGKGGKGTAAGFSKGKSGKGGKSGGRSKKH